MNSRTRITVALVGLIVLVVVGWFVQDATGVDQPSSGPATAANAVPGATESDLPVRPLSSLPGEATRTSQLITEGGPFPFPSKDGTVFSNREHSLPQHKSGYYHEYTVPTPGSSDRGARRLVTGLAAELYYTGDHYDSFVVVDPRR